MSQAKSMVMQRKFRTRTVKDKTKYTRKGKSGKMRQPVTGWRNFLSLIGDR